MIDRPACAALVEDGACPTHSDYRLSACTHDKVVFDSYDLGVNSSVSKPVQFEELARVVGEPGMDRLLLNRLPVPPEDGR